MILALKSAIINLKKRVIKLEEFKSKLKMERKEIKAQINYLSLNLSKARQAQTASPGDSPNKEELLKEVLKLEKEVHKI